MQKYGHDISKILLKVALSTNQSIKIQKYDLVAPLLGTHPQKEGFTGCAGRN
jgi:hypothetical protein